MAFIRIFTYVVDTETPDLGLPINDSEVEKVEVFFRADFVVYIEGKGAGEGCEISMVNGECFYVDESPAQVMGMITKATNGLYTRSN